VNAPAPPTSPVDPDLWVDVVGQAVVNHFTKPPQKIQHARVDARARIDAAVVLHADVNIGEVQDVDGIRHGLFSLFVVAVGRIRRGPIQAPHPGFGLNQRARLIGIHAINTHMHDGLTEILGQVAHFPQ
jgi:hypothetical protein